MKVHIIGIPGSGKTTLAERLSQQHGAPAYDLDYIVFSNDGERPLSEIEARVQKICASEAWITEGAYRSTWLTPLLTQCDEVVWLDVPVTLGLVRIVRRHILAEVRRNNPHPGWRRLLVFLNYTLKNGPRMQREIEDCLAPFEEKVRRVRST